MAISRGNANRLNLGHGAYQAPDWTADWLHREIINWLDIAAQAQYGVLFDELTEQQKQPLLWEVKREYRTNTYDKQSDTVTLSTRRIAAIKQTAQYYNDLFGGAEALQQTRKNYAMKEVTLPDPERRQRLTEFFFDGMVRIDRAP